MLAFIALPAAARQVELVVRGIRYNEGRILVTAGSDALAEPLYAAVEARAGSVSVQLDLPDDAPSDIRLFHDRDGDMIMRTDDTGSPLDGVAVVRYNPAKGKTRISVSLYYAECR